MEARREVDPILGGPHWVKMGYTVYPHCYIYIHIHIYIYKHGPGISPLRKIWDYMVCIWIINHLLSGMHILYGSYVVDNPGDLIWGLSENWGYLKYSHLMGII
jgi:hypothetical protein